MKKIWLIFFLFLFLIILLLIVSGFSKTGLFGNIIGFEKIIEVAETNKVAEANIMKDVNEKNHKWYFIGNVTIENGEVSSKNF